MNLGRDVVLTAAGRTDAGLAYILCVRALILKGKCRCSCNRTSRSFGFAAPRDSTLCAVTICSSLIKSRKQGELWKPEAIKRGVNFFLGKENQSIVVIGVETVPSAFHARFSAISRTYLSLSPQRYRSLRCGMSSASLVDERNGKKKRRRESKKRRSVI